MVIDSSTLVSLAKIQSLGILENLNAEIFCPVGVKKETVESGLLRQFDDAFEIQKIFEKNLIKIDNDGGNDIDKAVLALAAKTKAEYVLCNDVSLARRAVLKKFKVKGSSDILLEFYKNNYLSKKEFFQKLGGLVAKKRLSAKNARFYFKEAKK